MVFNAFPDSQDRANLGMRQKDTPPQERRNEEKYLYFPSLLLLSMYICQDCFCAQQQSCMQHRHPCIIVQGGLRWCEAAHCAPVQAEESGMRRMS